MTDIFETPTQPFQPSTPPAGPEAEKPNGTGNGRRKRGPRRQSAAGESPAEPTPKRRGRPPKGDSRPQSAAAAGKKRRPGRPPKVVAVPPPGALPVEGGIDLHRIMGATVGLDETESQFVADVLHRLQSTDKRSRVRIAASLGRIFG